MGSAGNLAQIALYLKAACVLLRLKINMNDYLVFRKLKYHQLNGFSFTSDTLNTDTDPMLSTHCNYIFMLGQTSLKPSLHLMSNSCWVLFCSSVKDKIHANQKTKRGQFMCVTCRRSQVNLSQFATRSHRRKLAIYIKL